MEYSLLLNIPELPTSNNKQLRANGFARNTSNKKWYATVSALAHGRVPAEPLTKFVLRLHRYGHAFMDYDNLVSSFKPVVDGLVRAGIIQDDRWDFSGPWIVGQTKIKKKEQGRITVFVTEISSVDVEVA